MSQPNDPGNYDPRQQYDPRRYPPPPNGRGWQQTPHDQLGSLLTSFGSYGLPRTTRVRE